MLNPSSIFYNEYELAGFLAKQHDLGELTQSIIIRETEELLMNAAPSSAYGRAAIMEVQSGTLAGMTTYLVTTRIKETEAATDKCMSIVVHESLPFKIKRHLVSETSEYLEGVVAMVKFSESFNDMSKSVLLAASRFILSPDATECKFSIRTCKEKSEISVCTQRDGVRQCEVVFRP